MRTDWGRIWMDPVSGYEFRVVEEIWALLLLGLKLALEQVCSTSCWKTDLLIFASSSGEGV